jgi:gluconolactonase
MSKITLTLLSVTFALLSAQSPVPEGATVELVADGFDFIEGPVWRTEGFLLFSDINANRVYKWSEGGGVEVFLDPSGRSNGLALDKQGNLLLAQHEKRRIAKLDSSGVETNLADRYDGKRLNSPNDLVVKADGAIYFTDPPYGLGGTPSELGFNGIFRLNPDGTLLLLDQSLSRPNGIAFTPDQKKLYVNDSQVRRIYVWDVQTDGTIDNKELFYFMDENGSADGMKVDTDGNLYSTGPGGIWIFKSDGSLLDRIAVPGQTTNCNWGESDRQTLYITSANTLYRIRLNATGVITDRRQSMLQRVPNTFELYKNYPNPFNAATLISFYLPRAAQVELTIFNVLGQEIDAIAGGYLAAGRHAITWQADPQPSGLYYYSLLAEGERQTRPMVLVK